MTNGGPLSYQVEPFSLKAYVIDIVNLSGNSRELDGSFLKKEYVEKGLSLRKLSEKYKCSKGKIRDRLVKCGVGDFGYEPERIEIDRLLQIQIISLREKGVSFQKIAERLNSNQVKTRTGTGRWHGKTIRELYTDWADTINR